MRNDISRIPLNQNIGTCCNLDRNFQVPEDLGGLGRMQFKAYWMFDSPYQMPNKTFFYLILFYNMT